MRNNVLCARDEKKVRKELSRENKQLNDFYYSLHYETRAHARFFNYKALIISIISITARRVFNLLRERVRDSSFYAQILAHFPRGFGDGEPLVFRAFEE